MDPRALLYDGRVGFILAGVGLLLLVWLLPRSRRRRTQLSTTPDHGIGSALAFALEGDLPRARDVLEGHLRATAGIPPETVVALLAVLRAQGDFGRAASLVQALARRSDASWIHAACVRLCLDAGQPARAAAYAQGAPTPPELAMAAFARAGQWANAVKAAAEVDKKRRRPADEASLLAGYAAASFRVGDERGARRRLKRALALAPNALAVLAVAARRAPRPADAERAEQQLAARLSGAGEGAGDGEGGALLAAEACADDEIERAMGILRDHLDIHPDDEPARRQYERWLLEHGNPEDWRAALADRAERGMGRAPDPRVPICGACGLVFREVAFICPRCDRFDTMQSVSRRPVDQGVQPSAAGARLTDLVAGGDPAAS